LKKPSKAAEPVIFETVREIALALPPVEDRFLTGSTTRTRGLPAGERGFPLGKGISPQGKGAFPDGARISTAGRATGEPLRAAR
jgi:hypothetical protein